MNTVDEVRQLRSDVDSLTKMVEELRTRLDEIESAKRSVNRRPDEHGEAIIKLLEQYPALTFTAATISEQLGIEEGLVHARIPTLARKGFITKVERENRRPIYRANPEA